MTGHSLATLGRRLMLSMSIMLLVSAGPQVRPGQTQNLVTVVEQAVDFNFGQQATFAATFVSRFRIRRATLLFTESDSPRVFAVDLPVEQSETQASVRYTADLKSHPLRPFATIEYWWQLETQDGLTVETEPGTFSYSDNRYPWQRAFDDSFQVFWATDDSSLGSVVLAIAREGLDGIQKVLSRPGIPTITIYVYPSLEEMRSALRLVGQDWAGGHADLELNVIMLSADGGPASNLELQRTLPHEVAHLVTNHQAGSAHRVPAWLQEGLAIGNEPRPDPSLEIALARAVNDRALIPLASFCYVFPYDESNVLLAYAESASLVSHVRRRYGDQKLQELIAAYGDGADCSGAIEQVLGQSLTTLETEWLNSLVGTEAAWRPAKDLAELGLWIGLVAAGSVLALTLFWFRPRFQRGVSGDQAR